MNKFYTKEKIDWEKELLKTEERLKFLNDNSMSNLEVKRMLLENDYKEFLTNLSDNKFIRLTQILGNQIWANHSLGEKITIYQEQYKITVEEIKTYLKEIRKEVKAIKFTKDTDKLKERMLQCENVLEVILLPDGANVVVIIKYRLGEKEKTYKRSNYFAWDGQKPETQYRTMKSAWFDVNRNIEKYNKKQAKKESKSNGKI